MSEKPSELPSNSGKTEILKPAKPRAASKGKRLLALLLDFILALLLMNTLDQFFNRPDWYDEPREIQLGLQFSW